jgi:hypothetical protein
MPRKTKTSYTRCDNQDGQYTMYCVKCRGSKVCSNVVPERDVRGRLRVVSVCDTCGTNMYRYVKEY